MVDFHIPLPEVDEYGTPQTKMPNCPNCGEDELGLIWKNEAFCYLCGVRVGRKIELEHAYLRFRSGH